MSSLNKLAGLLSASSVALAAFTGAAIAEDQFEWSANLAGTSEYVFRGITQTLEDPAIQGGLDASYGIFYVGVWASGVDFVEGGAGGADNGDASIEVDLYAGITPKLGPVDFDLGVIYYAYPGANDPDGGEFDYVEFKLGASGSPIQNLTAGATYYISPDQFGEVGVSHVVEGSLGYELPKVWLFTPTIDGLVGALFLDDDSSQDYVYWNAGLALAVENMTFDFRYWDTDSNGADFCADAGACDERFVFTASVSVP